MAEQTQNSISVIAPDGTLGTVPINQAQAALVEGYRVATEDEISYEKRKQLYGTGIDQALQAAAEGVAKSAPFVGGYLQRAVNPNPESRLAHEEQFGGIQFGSEVAGTIGQMFLPFAPVKAISAVGKAAEAASVAKGLSIPAAKAVGGLVEGALFSTGQVVNEAELGNTKDLGERLAVAIPLGATIGALSGYGMAKASEYIKNKAAKSVKITPEEAKEVEQQANKAAGINNAETEKIYEQAKSEIIPEPKTDLGYEELTKQLEGIDERLITETGRPRKDILLEARELTKNRLKIPLQNFQIEAMDDREVEQFLKTFELKKPGLKLRNLKASQKADMLRAMNDVVSEIAPDYTPNTSKVSAGEMFRDVVDGIAKKNKEQSTEFFNAFKNVAGTEIQDVGGLIGAIESAIPGITNHIKADAETGAMKLIPYDIGMGFDRNTYKVVKDLLNHINRGEVSIGSIERARTAMLPFTEYGNAKMTRMHVGGLRSKLLEYIEPLVDKAELPVGLRDGFRQYAKSQKELSTIEKIIRGSVSVDEAAPAPEKILNSIFGDSKTVSQVKSILGDKFNNHLADRIAIAMDEAVNKETGEFSSAKFASFLNKKDSALLAAFADNPNALNELDALNTQIRLVADAGPANPPNTAETLTFLKYLSGADSSWEAGKRVLEYGKTMIKEGAENTKAIETFNAIQRGQIELAKEQAKKSVYENYISKKFIEEAAAKTQKAINSGIKSIIGFDGLPQVATQIGIAATKEDRRKQFEEISQNLKEISINGEKSLNNLSDLTSQMSQHAPEVAQSLQSTTANQVYFLANKLPKEPPQTLFSKPYQPSDGEIAEFLHYYRAVNDPMTALKDIKNGVLTKQSVEAIATVYPSLYQNMSSELISRVADSKKEIPYHTKLMISMFLNQPLDYSLQPKFILSNQQSLATPSVQQNAMPQQGIKPTQKGLEKLNVADRILTPMQKSQQRRE